MRELLGVSVPFGEAARILADLGFSLSGHRGDAGDETAEVSVPTYRPDVHGEADLIEEVIRVRGLDVIPTVLPAIRPQPARSTLVLENWVRQAAMEVGLSEAITYAFISPKELAALGLGPAPLHLLNPLSEERSVLRTSLLPGLLEALRRARHHGVSDVRLFTVAARFLEPDPNVVASAVIDQSLGHPSPPLPDEVPSFAAVVAGNRRAVLDKPQEIDVYDAKGLAVEIVERVTRQRATVAPQPAERRAPYLHPRGAGDVLVGGAVVGSFGPLHPDAADALDLGGGCVVVELDLRALERAGIRTPRYQPIPMLPAVTRDLAVVVSDDVTAGAVEEAIREAGRELCESVELFDLFRGAQVPEGHRSLAFHVVYRDPKAATEPEFARTLTDEEVDQRHHRVVETVKKRFGAVLRA
jgi:phenylalanyl-tRNA synthetase beta chain